MKFGVTATVCLVLVAMPALAAEDSRLSPGERFLSVWDLNGNGEVTRDELETMRGRIFSSFDRNGDDVLNRAEYVAFDKARAGDVSGYRGAARQRMQRITDGMSRTTSDADGDGKVSREEFIAGAQGWLADLDRNGDGVITRADFPR